MEWVSYKGDPLTKPENVKGFNHLNDADKLLFSRFLKNFYERWEFPEEHLPISVRKDWDKANGHFLRVCFHNNRWLHVKDTTTWY